MLFRSVEADADEHDDIGVHPHYFAILDAWYDSSYNEVHWTEYGPALTEQGAQELCNSYSGDNTQYVVSNESYLETSTGIYLKITGVVENRTWLNDYRKDRSILDINDTSIVSHEWNDELDQHVEVVDTYSYEKTGPETGLLDRKSTRLNSSHSQQSRMPSSA